MTWEARSADPSEEAPRGWGADGLTWEARSADPYLGGMRLYDTLTRGVRELEQRRPGRFDMYVCGPTVQSGPHFGHARAFLVPDVLRRYLEWRGVEVFHVRNVTDVEDKIIAAAAAEGIPPAALVDRNLRLWDAQLARLRILPPHIAPRASGHIPEMLELIARLVARGSAYRADGDVYFAVRSFPGYGRLSGRSVDELRAGARVAPDERKRDPADFALWKAAKPGEPSWAAPWGRGRPGWHIECSAMAHAYLGDAFDLHAGGLDLQFPHHENEIAQSEAASGTTFARHWMHNGLLELAGAKMSKSVGNVISLDSALDDYGPDVIRLFVLQVAYRAPVELAEERLVEARTGLERLRGFVRASAGLGAATAETDEAATLRARFVAAMDDDLGTPGALAVLFGAAGAGNQHLEAGRAPEASALRVLLLELGGALGFTLDEAAGGADGLVGPLVAELLRLRAEARDRRDYAAADGIRDRLGALGVVVEDRPDGARWHRT